ncbi:MAG: hypothetical protein GF355_15065 [Candidatus Eisenbacteria bacterium]|nr:hypothetical protein [Candidatus Eisenbacteria bacterium]
MNDRWAIIRQAIPRTLRGGIALVALAVLLVGCGSEDDSITDLGDTTADSGQLVGTVRAAGGGPVAGVTVRAGAKTTTTNSQGYFVVSDAAATDRLVVEFVKAGYATAHEVTRVRTGSSSDLGVLMKGLGATGDIDAGAGGTVDAGDHCSVVLPAGSLVDQSGSPFTGTASVDLTTFLPTVEAERRAYPGKFDGLSAAGADVPVSSYGAVDVSLSGGGGELSLAGGQTATLKIPIAAELLTTAPQTTTLWSFDVATGKWREEGQAAKTGGSYTGTVSHFSDWMAGDAADQTHRVTGRVVDGGGNAVQGARVTVTGANFQYEEPMTGANGAFAIDANCAEAAVVATVGDQNSSASGVTCAGGGNAAVGDLVLNAPRVTITLSWGADPEDLDLHLAIPSDGGHTHLYYPDHGQWVAGARLNTDAQNGYGPEVITIVDLHDGVYRCSVHHYSGDGTMTAGGAQAFMTVSGVGAYPATPPAGASGAKDVWRMWDITVSGGKVTSVTPINDYLHDVTASDVSAFAP